MFDNVTVRQKIIFNLMGFGDSKEREGALCEDEVVVRWVAREDY